MPFPRTAVPAAPPHAVVPMAGSSRWPDRPLRARGVARHIAHLSAGTARPYRYGGFLVKKYFRGLAVAAGLAATVLPGTAHAEPGLPEAWSLFRNAGLHACVDAAPGDNTVVAECDGSRSQRWLLENLGAVTGEYGVFRIRKNDRECAELAGTWSSAVLRLSPCDPAAPGQRFLVTRAGEKFGNVHLYGDEHRQILRADHRGAAPFTSATPEWPGDNVVWTFRPAR